MHLAVFGAGLVGRRTAAILAREPSHRVVLVAQRRPLDAEPGLPVPVATATGWPNPKAAEARIVVLATEALHQFAVAKELIRNGIHVITTADDPREVERLWALDALARSHRVSLGVGATYSPGVSSLLVRWLADAFDEISVITTARFGTGGPACAREHHRAMSASGVEVYRGALRPTRPGSGRELVWFPDPAGPADCFRAALAEPFILHHTFPDVGRIESRQAATRRDRLTARLPMLRSPHAEGLVGAVWAEVRGRIAGRIEHRVVAATAPQATGAAAMAAAMARSVAAGMSGAGPTDVVQGWQGDGGIPVGVWSAAGYENPARVLQVVSDDVRLWTYHGVPFAASSTDFTAVQPARKWRLARETPGIATK